MKRRRFDPWREAWRESWRHVREQNAIRAQHSGYISEVRGEMDELAGRALLDRRQDNTIEVALRRCRARRRLRERRRA